MTASDSPELVQSADWFQPDTYSVWLYDREGDDEPMFYVLYEWEIMGLRGLRLVEGWGVISELGVSKEEWHGDHQQFLECDVDEQIEAMQLIRLIEAGNLHRVGVMPAVGRYAEPYVLCLPQGRPKRREIPR